LFFTFAGAKDQIIAFGAADYTASAPEFDSDQPVVRPSVRRHRQVHGCAWPGHQHAGYGWYVHASYSRC
jgi:hypothetical protein